MTTTNTRVAIVEWPDGLNTTDDKAWQAIASSVTAANADIIVTNELPFGAWLASSPTFDRTKAEESIKLHDVGMQSLANLSVPAIISSRPVWEGDRLANEAVLIHGGVVGGIHRKQYFPSEPGWHEDQWFATQARDYAPVRIGSLSVGILLCTELMFNEHARAYGRQGVDLIAIPRASGETMEHWHLAARMAALVSGCYVVSANRVGSASGGPAFGGQAFAYSPDGHILGQTSRQEPILTINVDSSVVAEARNEYPRYVLERT